MKMLILQPISRISTISDAFILVYHIFVLLIVVLSVWRGWYWAVQLEFHKFEWKHLLGLVHVALFICTPLANIAWFGFFVEFDFESWRRQCLRELHLRDTDIIDTYTNVLSRIFVYSTPILVVLYSIVQFKLASYSMNTRIYSYDYVPLIVLELYNIAPAVRYLDVTLNLRVFHDYVSKQILLCTNHRKYVQFKYEYAYTGELPSFSRRNTKILVKLQLDIIQTGCTILGREFGISLILLVFTYSMSLIHDCAYLLAIDDIWIFIISAFRTAHRFTFLVVFFIIGQRTSCAVGFFVTRSVKPRRLPRCEIACKL